MAHLPPGVTVSERQTIQATQRLYEFGFPAIRPEDVYVSVNNVPVDRQSYQVSLNADRNGGTVRFLTPVQTQVPFGLVDGQQMDVFRNTPAKDVVDVGARGYAQAASVQSLEEQVLRVTEEVVASLTGDVSAAVRNYLSDNPVQVPQPPPQVKSDWTETDPMDVSFIDNKPAELSLNSEGPTWLTSALLPTTVLAEEGIIWPSDGTQMPDDQRGPTQWTFGGAASGNDTGQVIRPNFSPAARVNNSFLSLQPDAIPPEAIGIWVIAEQSRNAAGTPDSTPGSTPNWVVEGKVMLPIGPGAGVQDSSGGVSGTEAILVTGYNRTQQHTIEVNYYAWEPLGHVTIALRGDGNAPPSNVRIRIAPAGVYGTGLVGPRGPAGPAGGGPGGGVSDYRDLTNKPGISTQGGEWLRTNTFGLDWPFGEDRSEIFQVRWTKAAGSPAGVQTNAAISDGKIPGNPPANTIGLWAVLYVNDVEQSRGFIPYAAALSEDEPPLVAGLGSTVSHTHAILFASREDRRTLPDGRRISLSGMTVRFDMSVSEEGGDFSVRMRWNRGRVDIVDAAGNRTFPLPLMQNTDPSNQATYRTWPANTHVRVYPATIALVEPQGA